MCMGEGPPKNMAYTCMGGMHVYMQSHLHTCGISAPEPT